MTGASGGSGSPVPPGPATSGPGPGPGPGSTPGPGPGPDRSGHVYRVEWVPGTDHLLGRCFCGAQHLDADPIAIWEWLYGHPRGHDLLPAGSFPGQLHEVPA